MYAEDHVIGSEAKARRARSLAGERAERASSHRAKLMDAYFPLTGNFAFMGFLAALLAGLAVGLALSRLILRPDHTPVPCMESVAPTAYRAPSNAVFMVQKIGMV